VTCIIWDNQWAREFPSWLDTITHKWELVDVWIFLEVACNVTVSVIWRNEAG
jgi:hypothetical protein